MLLEDLVEQEKREQVKQNLLPGSNLNTSFPLSDSEFERLKADVLNVSVQTLLPSQGVMSLIYLKVISFHLKMYSFYEIDVNLKLGHNMQTALVSSSNTIQTNIKLSSPGNVFELPQQQSWSQSTSNIQSSNVSSVQVNNPLRTETR